MTSNNLVSGLMLPLWEEVKWPFLVRVGQCAAAHNLLAVECPREVRAVW